MHVSRTNVELQPKIVILPTYIYYNCLKGFAQFKTFEIKKIYIGETTESVVLHIMKHKKQPVFTKQIRNLYILEQ